MTNWIRLGLSLVVLVVTVGVLIPWVSELGVFRPLVQSNMEKGVDATGLFYTDTREFSGADNHLRNTLVGEPVAHVAGH